MHFSRYAVENRDATFADLAGVEWAKETIEMLAAKGIGSNEYDPRSGIARAEFMTLLMRAAALPQEDG